MNPDQILPAAIVAVIVILVVAGIVRVATRRPPAEDPTFGAGGTNVVADGTRGIAETDLSPFGNVRAVGESWSAKSADGATIPAGTNVLVVAHEGLTLVVEAVAAPAAQQ